MLVRGDHGMSVVVRIQVEQHEAVTAAMHDEIFLVGLFGRLVAEDTR
jgi:hypothetical protein